LNYAAVAFSLGEIDERGEGGMAAKILAVAQQKGGAGKTTIAVQLGVFWAKAGRKVALLDVDPQGSMKAWHGLRAEAGIDGWPTAHDVAGWKLSSEIDRLKRETLKRETDLIIVDTPPHAETDARVAVRAAGLILVPVQPSPMDWWATKPTIDMAAKEKTRSLLVLNRLPPRGRLVDAIREKIRAAGLPLAENALGNRSAFAVSMMEGKGVTESQPRGTAAAEIAALAAEIDGILTAL
jgi:chromosome partitioning protein